MDTANEAVKTVLGKQLSGHDPWGQRLDERANACADKVKSFLENRGFLQSACSPVVWEIARRATVAVYGAMRPGVVLAGNTGVGKTFLAEAVCRGISRRFNLGSADTDELLSLRNVEFARPGYEDRCAWFLDDVGSESVINNFGTKVDVFGAFLMRFDALPVEAKKMNPVVITTNLDQNAMQERYGDRVMSRLGRFPWFEIRGADRRIAN